MEGWIFSLSRKRDFQKFDKLAVQSLLNLLAQVDLYPCLYFNESQLVQSIRRYEHLWIPLLLSIPPDQALLLVPPLDIEWVWMCHMICPIQYVDDCEVITSHMKNPRGIINHVILPEKARKKGLEKAEIMWCRVFPNEPFQIADQLSIIPTVAPRTESDQFDSRISCDITSVAKKQMDFYYQVGIPPHYRQSEKFLNCASIRYEMFLDLRASHPTSNLVSTYDIELMRRAHMLHPSNYKKKSRKLSNRTLQPKWDSIRDRPEDDFNLRNWENTKILWKRKYNFSISKEGSMWRGRLSNEERLLGPRIQSAVRKCNLYENNSSCHLNHSKFVIETGTEVNDEFQDFFDVDKWSAIPWVHSSEMMDYGRSNPFLISNFSDTNAPFVRRISSLTSIGTGTGMGRKRIEFACVTIFGPEYIHRWGLNGVPTVIEIYGKSGTEEGLDGIPIASAHTPQPGSFRKPPPGLDRHEWVFLQIRIGGEDIGMLGGYWECDKTGQMNSVQCFGDFTDFDRSADYEEIDSKFGSLVLYFSSFQENGDWKVLKSMSNGMLNPDVYSMKVKENESEVAIDLANGTVKSVNINNITLAYVVALASASIYTMLYPRFVENDEWYSSDFKRFNPQFGKLEIFKAVGGDFCCNKHNYDECSNVNRSEGTSRIENPSPRNSNIFSALETSQTTSIDSATHEGLAFCGCSTGCC